MTRSGHAAPPPLRPGHRIQCLMNGCLNAVFPLIVARIVAIYLCFDCGRDVWHGFVERKIRPYSPDFVDWFNPWLNIVAHRDATPIRYWIIMGRPHNYFLFMPRCCDIWVVAPKHLSIADGPSATSAIRPLLCFLTLQASFPIH